ncbi:glycosyltransferase family 4 protein [Gimesia maris]|uniref:glycosyltransferase family 4 protein n=1 Tax=Gimesia maris TaxID=122 RepID=UPI003A8EF0C5
MHIAYLDRSGAHAIWRLMDATALSVIADSHRATYVKMRDGRQRPALPPPTGVSEQNIDVPASRFSSDPRSTASFKHQFRSWCQKAAPQIVHTNFCVPGSLARKIAKRQFQIPVVTTCHEMFDSMNPFLQWGVRRTEKYADAIVYISQGVAQSYRPDFDPDQHGVDRNDPRHRLIYNGIDVEHIQAVVQQAHQTSAQNRPTSGPVLLSVGRLVPEKGHGTVIAALPDIVRRHPNLKYVILGEGPNRDALLQQARSLGVAEHLEMPGWVDHNEAIRQMAVADGVIMPSLSVQEGFGLALAEAMLCETPIVASRIPVFEEVAGGESDVLSFFREGDSCSLGDRVQSILAGTNESKDFQPLVDRVAEKFDVKRMAQAYLDLYRQLHLR